MIQTTDVHPFWVVSDSPDTNRMARELVSVENVGSEDILFSHKNIGATETGYYVETGDLLVGDVFLGPSGEPATLEKTVREEHPNGITVYNFAVENNHNYFVVANLEAFQNGAQPVLVHNSKFCAADIEEHFLNGPNSSIHKSRLAVRRADRHHVFPQEHRSWFDERKFKIDRFTIELDQGTHSAVHTMGWNDEIMKRLNDAEKSFRPSITSKRNLENRR